MSSERSSNLRQQQRFPPPPPAHGNLIKYVLNFEFVIGRQGKDGDRERESETQITGHSALLSHKMQEKMAAEAGNKATTAQRHEATTQNVSFIFKIKTVLPHGQTSMGKETPEATWIPLQRVSQDNFPQITCYLNLTARLDYKA